jgi:hypothetical protein
MIHSSFLAVPALRAIVPRTGRNELTAEVIAALLLIKVSRLMPPRNFL